MYRYERETLEAIVKARFVKYFELSDLVGYAQSSMSRALADLHKKDLIYRGSGYWAATERGKIVLAVTLGKETRARALRFGMAA